jgi:hypothetical protein
MADPEPIRGPALQAAVTQLEAGADLRSALERLLLALDDEQADAFMMLTKEGRAAWLPLVHGSGGRALFVGNALSGSIVPLCDAGYHVVVLDTHATRLRFSACRSQALSAGRTSALCAGADKLLPLLSNSFDLVVQEGGLPTAAGGWGFAFSELERVARSELLLVCDNRFAYKRSTGRRGVFAKAGPVEFVRRKQGMRSLPGYRQLFGQFESLRPYALYPDAREFSHVVALDEARPRLTVGPRERKNVLKVVAQRLGLFPFLTPSFAFVAGRTPNASARIERIVAQLAERLGRPTPAIDMLVATRSNTCLVHTDSADAASRWTLHIPLSPQKLKLTRIHHAALGHLREHFPDVRVPQPLFEGRLEGLHVVCEERLPEWTAPDITGQQRASGVLFAQTSAALSQLVVRPRAALTADDFETMIAPRFARVRRFAAVSETQRVLDRMGDELRERLVGEEFPLVYYHADLRPKHVQVTPRSELVGLLDWGAREPAFLPYVDLLMLVAHHRHQEEGTRPARAWQLIQRQHELRDYERAALEDYAARLNLSSTFCSAIERVYPVLVGDMAERNWDYSRPRWLHRQYRSGVEYDL